MAGVLCRLELSWQLLAFFNNHKLDVGHKAAQALAERLLEVIARLDNVIQGLDTVGELAKRSIRRALGHAGGARLLTLSCSLRTFLRLNTCFKVGLFPLRDVGAGQRSFDTLTYLSTPKQWISLHLQQALDSIPALGSVVGQSRFVILVRLEVTLLGHRSQLVQLVCQSED